MKSKFKLFVVAILASATLVGCSTGPERVRKIAITDEQTIGVMNDIATAAMKNYFDVDVNDGVPRNVAAESNELLVDAKAKTYVHSNNVIKISQQEKPAFDQLDSYAIVLSPDNSEVRGAVMSIHSERPVIEYTDQQLIEMSVAYAKEKQLVEDPSTLIFEEVDKEMSADNLAILKFKNGENYLLVGVNLQFNEVMYFEYVYPAVQIDAAAE